MFLISVGRPAVRFSRSAEGGAARRRAARSHQISVVIARGRHLFPFRTEQLRPSAPMVLGSQGPGRVGRRRFELEGPSPRGAALLRCGPPCVCRHRPSALPTPRLRAVFVLGISTLGIILIAIGVLVVLFAIGGAVAVVKRSRAQDATFAEHVEAADSALEQARALDKGWHRDTMEEAARAAIADSRPGWTYDDLQLVLVDDRPRVSEDRAHFMAMGSD